MILRRETEIFLGFTIAGKKKEREREREEIKLVVFDSCAE